MCARGAAYGSQDADWVQLLGGSEGCCMMIVNRDAPLPLEGSAASWQALRLRQKGMTYAQIAIVMGEYHGAHRSSHSWRSVCRQLGAAPVVRGYGTEETA